MNKILIITLALFYCTLNKAAAFEDIFPPENEATDIFNALSSNMLENKHLFQHIPQYQIVNNHFDDISGAKYEYDNRKFKHIDDINQDAIEDIALETIQEHFNQTELGKNINTLSNHVSTYFALKYMLTEDDTETYQLPWTSKNLSTNNFSMDNKKYGVSFATKLFGGSDLIEVIFELETSYDNSTLFIEYEPAEGNTVFTLSNIRVEQILGINAMLNHSNDNSNEQTETYTIIKIKFEF